MKYPSPADIAEMRAKGYDSSTIAEAIEKSKRWEAAQLVESLVEAAFSGVTLGNGVGLQQAQGKDDYADAETCAAYRAKDEKEDWHRISTDELNRCNSSLSFFDAEGMRFHLPAFLLCDLRGDYGFGMAFCLTYLSDHCVARFEILSPAQRAAVRAFLLHIVDDPNERFHREDILRALAGYWAD